MNLERIEVDGLVFDIRPDTSDEKAVREVVQRRNYGRYNFTPGGDEHWVDLGANVGAFSIWAASQSNEILVEAYEPDPEMCELIYRNAELNQVTRQINITQAAVVADDRQTVTLHCNVARGNVWRNSIERDWRGGQDIDVPAVSIREVIGDISPDDKLWMKIDIEGTEMPILEFMLKRGNSNYLPEGMVFEWSFDVDPSIARFQAVIEKLKKNYKFLKGDNLGKIGSLENWPQEAFPPCRLVYCCDV